MFRRRPRFADALAPQTLCPSRQSRCYTFPVSTSSESLQIRVNGETRSANPGATVSDLLRDLGLPPGRVAIERNLEILPRAKWSETQIASGDCFEIVQFVGGG